MRNETLFVNDRSVRLLTSDQLTPDEIAAYSRDASRYLGDSDFTNPVDAAELAKHMAAGRTTVFVEHDSRRLLAHAFGEDQTDGTTEIRGWFSKMPGLGGRVLEAIVQEERDIRGVKLVHAAVQTGNEDGLRSITRIGGEPILRRPSRTPDREVIVFDITRARVPERKTNIKL